VLFHTLKCVVARFLLFSKFNTLLCLTILLVCAHFIVLWDSLSQQLSEKLQKLQNHAARVITKSSYDTNSTYLLNSLSWDNLSGRGVKREANLMYKCVNKLIPVYLCNTIVHSENFVLWSLRRMTKIVFTKTKNWLPEA